jgi:PAS domain S-box-containing protein
MSLSIVPPGDRRNAPQRRKTDAVDRLFDLSLDMLGTASAEGYFTRLNPAWERTLGWTAVELMARPMLSFVHPDDVAAARERVRRYFGPDLTMAPFENRYRCRDGSYRWIQWSVVLVDRVLYFVARDVTDDKAAQAERDQDASMLRAILESVADGLYVADSSGKLTFMNPAGARLLGYESADELLGLGAHSTLHHTHADGSPYGTDDCPLTQVRTNGHPVHVHDDDFWRKDGTAMPVSYSSAPVTLHDGRGNVVAFRDITEQRARDLRARQELDALSWVSQIRAALDERRFVLYAQPIVSVVTGEMIHHELLIRMVSPSGEVIAPGSFLPVAESHGQIQEIDRRVFEMAMVYAAAGHRVGVNLSADSLSEPGLFRHVEEQLRSGGVDPHLIVFEVTETGLMHNEGVAQVFIENVRQLGCGVALDDFGTGYGSFRYLKNLPVSLLKIDQEFVRDLEGEASHVNRHVIETIVALARGMGQKTVAEGVETAQSLRIVRQLGVDYAQGYHFARPTPADDVFQASLVKGGVDA